MAGRLTVAVLPEITVVIPTRDRWPVVSRAALAAALRQEDIALEVIVVDDGSVAGPPDVLPGIQDERVRVVRHPEPRGVAVARNAGIAGSRGTWVAFLDDDDLWAPSKLRQQVRAAEDAGAGFAYAAAVWVNEALELVRGHAPPPPERLADDLLRWNVVWGGASNVIARRDLLESLGGFDEELFQLADWDLWIRLALAAPAAVVRDVLVALVVHGKSMLLVDPRDVFLEVDRLAEKHRDAAARAGVTLDRARFARWVATGHLLAGRRRAAARAYVRGTKAPGNVVRAAGTFLGPGFFETASSFRHLVPGALGAGERVADRPSWLSLYA
ncbi:MAG TPA: glycosyltransferase family 2 protein [Gaiellaceae bacterium]|nr:glycosyltransferase family 2 protein [Gaiellaceae bacterium]